MPRRHLIWFILILACYAVSFLLPVLRIEPSEHRTEGIMYGRDVFLSGVTMIAAIGLAGAWAVLALVSWCANLCFWWACLKFAGKSFQKACRWSLASILLALAAFPLFFFEPYFDHARWMLLGYWLWLGSFIMMTLSSLRLALQAEPVS